ncbi:hypothetical protein TELCIR_01886 [Teladorsagia circumcincta]|uniref:Uncharacterized protein n=1 Tax=Teladorsagia circumcincta TaxID=45464 RepID=A0A2G9V2V0_TELCI|nr:hypothetical protein TELCIR_01886 [Teladorsagia circumcincta]
MYAQNEDKFDMGSESSCSSLNEIPMEMDLTASGPPISDDETDMETRERKYITLRNCSMLKFERRGMRLPFRLFLLLLCLILYRPNSYNKKVSVMELTRRDAVFILNISNFKNVLIWK